ARLTLLHATLGALELLTALSGVDFPRLAELDRLLFAGDYRGFSEGLSFAARFFGDARCSLFRRRLGRNLRAMFSRASEYKKNRDGEDEYYAKRGIQRGYAHWIYAPTRRTRHAIVETPQGAAA